MSADVEVFWFTAPPRYRAHAFELVNGELAAKSICTEVSIDDAADEPQREPIPPTVVLCRVCRAVVMQVGRASA